MNEARWKRAEWALLVLLAWELLWKGIIPGWRFLNSDFANYYVVARLLREGYGLDRIYDWVWLQRVKDHLDVGVGQSVVGFAGLTPFSALPVLPLTLWSVTTAKRLWLLINMVLLGTSAGMVGRATSLGRRRAWLLCLLLVVPLRTSFLDGQMHILVLLLLVMAYGFESRGRRDACGVCLGIAGALKVYPLLFGFYFLWKRRWREVGVIAAVALGAGLLCGVMMGWHVVHVYLTQVFPASLRGEVVDPYNATAASGAALFHRLFLFEPEFNPFPLIRTQALYALLYPLWQAVVLLPVFAAFRMAPEYADSDERQLDWAVFLVMLLLLSSAPSSYHFVVLLLPCILFIDVLLRRQQEKVLTVVVALYAGIGVVNLSPIAARVQVSPVNVIVFARFWLETMLWGVFVWYLWRERNVLVELKGNRLRAGLVIAPFALFWAVGFFSWQRHFSYWDTDMARRVEFEAHPFLATRPVARRGGFVFTQIGGRGYNVVDQAGQSIVPMEQWDGRGDSLSVAVHGEVAMVEIADNKGSQMVEVPPHVRDEVLHLDDAETPVFAPDGSSLAYIHEVRGKGSLWVVQMQADHATPASLLEVVSATSDVRDVTYLSPGELLFTAKNVGKTKLYRMPGTRASGPVLFYSGKSDVDSPAVSTDGKMLAFRALVEDHWRLKVMDLKTRAERQLTAGDCNAYTPAWLDRRKIIYATDCGRGMGVTALATVGAGGSEIER